MKRICFFTGTRAEYGLLRSLMQQAAARPDIEFQCIVTGTHLSEEHGKTVREIEADGLPIHARIDLHLGPDSPADIGAAMGRAVAGCAATFQRLRPEMLVLLGDRYEALAAACAATLCGVPIAHIHGGESTLGAMDEVFRHAITKMSHLHFTATEAYRHRVIQMGESPEFVLNTGSLGVENIKKLHLLSRTQLEQDLGISFSEPLILGTYHPVTLERGTSERYVRQFLDALESIPDARILLTKANSDSEGREINRLLDDFGAAHPMRARVFTSLGLLRYLSVMRHASVVAGNSSSGIIEAPSFGIPTVNVGNRQRGRIRAQSVIDCAEDAESIAAALRRALSPAFRQKSRTVSNPYEQADTSRAILDAIAAYTGGIIKPFHAIAFQD